MWLLQRQCKRGTVVQQNPANFGKQWFKQFHSKRCFESVCGKPNLSHLFLSLTCCAVHVFRVTLHYLWSRPYLYRIQLLCEIRFGIFQPILFYQFKQVLTSYIMWRHGFRTPAEILNSAPMMGPADKLLSCVDEFHHGKNKPYITFVRSGAS